MVTTPSDTASRSKTDTLPRAAVIGAGGWGKNLVNNLHEMGTLAGIADTNADHRRLMAETYPQVTPVADYREILESDIPAVLVATPVATHYDVVRNALEAGKHVFVEKPLTMDRDEAWALARLAESRGLILMVGHLLLFQPAILWLRDFLAGGGIGEVRGIHQERLGLGRVRAYENALWCLGTHDVAVQRLLLDGRQPATVRVNGQAILQPGIEDDVYLHLEYPGGVQSHLHCSWFWPERRRGLTILGSEGMIQYDEIRQIVTHHRKGVDERMEVRDAGSEVVYDGHGQPLRLELEHFLQGVAGGGPVRSDGRFGAEVVDLLVTATQLLRRAEKDAVQYE